MGMFDGIINSVSNAVSSIGLKDVVSPLIGAAGSFLGTQSANQANLDYLNQANAFNQAQTDKQMQFQKDMRATQYQTAVEDMKAAGLNPMLAYSQGGAGTPAGAAATSVAPPTRQNAFANAVNTALTAANTQQTLYQNKQIQASTNVADSQADNLDADTANKRDLNPNIKKELDILAAKELAIRAETRVANAKAALDEVIKPKYSAEGDYHKTFGWGPFALRDLGQAAGSASQVFNALKGTPSNPITTKVIK